MARRLPRSWVFAALLAAALPACLLPEPARGQTAEDQVPGPLAPITDMNIVVALDRSESVGLDDRAAQAESLAQALVDPRLLAIVKAGWHGRIGLAVMTWSSFKRTHVVVPWTVLSDRAAIDRVVDTMREYEMRGADAEHKPQTDIALALAVGTHMLTTAPFPTAKRILNIISDGVDNFGREASIDRDIALAEGITINGLIHARGHAIEVVKRFFEREVIGGPYAFVLATPTEASFTQAMLRKMLLEIASAQLSSRVVGSGSAAAEARPQKNPAGSAIGLSSASTSQPLMMR